MLTKKFVSQKYIGQIQLLDEAKTYSVASVDYMIIASVDYVSVDT